MTIAVIGAGGWGTALSVVAARAGAGVKLWSRSAAVVEEINRSRTNGAYLAGHEIPVGVGATVDAREALRGAEVVILAAPSHATRAVLEGLKPYARAGMIFVSATKGVEDETGRRIS
ncbi:MAG TPA: NAD(P)-binding domain-containing protein, partial [Pyrinomonadaceae bacterium]|nr:NAD(P)-binding domain-containing protein [Pyrinomonadaceae bacterium]